jgi:hypothetical protein
MTQFAAETAGYRQFKKATILERIEAFRGRVLVDIAKLGKLPNASG